MATGSYGKAVGGEPDVERRGARASVLDDLLDGECAEASADGPSAGRPGEARLLPLLCRAGDLFAIRA
jgi:hypothetical protein